MTTFLLLLHLLNVKIYAFVDREIQFIVYETILRKISVSCLLPESDIIRRINAVHISAEVVRCANFSNTNEVVRCTDI